MLTTLLDATHILHYLNFGFGLGVAYTAWKAAKLWRDASLVGMPAYDPPLASIGDNTELHVMAAVVQLNEAQSQIAISSDLNAKAAKWASRSAILTGITVLIGVIS